MTSSRPVCSSLKRGWSTVDVGALAGWALTLSADRQNIVRARRVARRMRCRFLPDGDSGADSFKGSRRESGVVRDLLDRKAAAIESEIKSGTKNGFMESIVGKDGCEAQAINRANRRECRCP